MLQTAKGRKKEQSLCSSKSERDLSLLNLLSVYAVPFYDSFSFHSDV